jgi:hypothetical protein
MTPASLNGPGGPVPMPRYGTARNRKSRLFSILQHPGPAVGVVPLQPSQPQSCSSPADSPMITTPTPLSPLLPHSNLPTGHSNIPAPFTATGPLSPDIVSLVVRSTLEQIGIQTVEINETRRRARGQTGLGQKREEIKKQQMKISVNADKEWKVSIQNLGWNPSDSSKDVVRRFWRLRYNTRTADDFFDYIPASNDLVAACRDSSSVPSDVFQLDFGKGWEKSIWNRTILRRISSDILTERETDGGWGLPDVSGEYLLGLLYLQLKRSCEAWSRMQPRFLSDNSRNETAQEAAERVIGQIDQRYQANSSRSRRKRVSIIFIFTPDLTSSIEI